MTETQNVEAFISTIEARSTEHHEAMTHAVQHTWWAIAGSVLRLELDSMIRVIYLIHQPRDRRNRILTACLTGKGFKDGTHRIPDREMIETARNDNGWVRTVYDFGNKFIHLTDAHNYADPKADPFKNYEDREDVIKYLNSYHTGTMHGQRLDDTATFNDITPYAPHVLSKITSNINSYTRNLRETTS